MFELYFYYNKNEIDNIGLVYTINTRRAGRTFPRDVMRAEPEGHPEEKSDLPELGLMVFHSFSIIFSQV